VNLLKNADSESAQRHICAVTGLPILRRPNGQTLIWLKKDTLSRSGLLEIGFSGPSPGVRAVSMEWRSSCESGPASLRPCPAEV